MKQIKIRGGNQLSGKIHIGGAKNSAVGLIPATLLASGKCTITNVPNISDRNALFDILKLLNVKVKLDKSVIQIDSSEAINACITEDLSSRLRASYYFMGVLLAKYKYVEIYLPGGCNIGARPIDLHLKGFEALGATITHKDEEHKYILEADRLIGTRINLDFASVGATINIMYAAALAEGTTVIENAAKEIEIINIADFLNNMGAKITGAGTSTITIEGVTELHGADIEVIPDRIEAGTYLLMGALLGKDFTVCGVNADHITSLLNKLKDMGVTFHINGSEITINKCEELKPINVTTLIYPGFPTDLGQPMSVVLTQANGTSLFEETIYENRMQHIKYVNEMGANIELKDNAHAVIMGPSKLHGATINATDLRGGAALVMAGLIAEGETVINNIEYILRGYENIIRKLKNVGADIQIIKAEE